MLKIDRERPDVGYQNAHGSLAQFLPWMAFLTDDVVMCKDGSFLVAFSFEGFDTEGVDTIEINTLMERIEGATAALEPGATLWWTTQRRQIGMQMPSNDMDNPGSRYVEAEWSRKLGESRGYVHRNTLAISFPTEGGTGRFFNVYSQALAQGDNMIQAAQKAVKMSLGSKNRLMLDAEETANLVTRFENQLSQFAAALTSLGLRRLRGKEFAAMLQRSVSPGSDQEQVAADFTSTYLDTFLGDESLTVHASYLQFDGDSTRYGATASIKAWPHFTQPGIFDVVQMADAELDFTVTFRTLETEDAKAYIEDVRRHNANFSKSLTGYFKEAVSQGGEEATPDNARLVQFNETDDALTDLGAGGTGGFMLATLTVFGRTPKDMEKRYAETMKLLRKRQFNLLREKVHLLSAWTGHIPGQLKEPVRWMFVSGENYADCLPVRAVKTGDPHNAYLTQQRGVETSALTTLETEDHIPYFFNWHESDLPHGIVIGPSRSGKSVLMMFLASQFNRYSPSQVFIFDKDLTCRIPTYMHDGKYLWLNREDAPMNPLAHINTEEDMRWFAQWVEILIESRGYPISAEDEKEIWETIKQVVQAKEKGFQVSLESFAIQLRQELYEQLQSWIGDGQRSSLFDNKEDALSFSHWTAMEMGGLYDDPRAARAFLDYAFHRIYQRLDGRPTMIYVEEAWFMLEDERFASKVNDWLRTLAKKNALLVLTTQSLEELSNSKAFVSMVDNIPNRIFLANPNARASVDLYTKKFGLNDEQVERIRTAIPKMQYYVCTPGASRMVEARFPPEILTHLRSDGKAQKAFEEAREHHGENWKEHYHEVMRSNF
ncbi:type IV secretory pathway VirB4 components-like protein [Thioalkalivibrio sp. ALE19]|uniref:VirB4 family type IV secretion/conjugal transfer ATPase n=1 Tax=Thioalkalivibrio sp. ALE19 TaxID=1266909 RepID=UPI0004093AC6|nr:type IV secretory pathway VirB4 components-like protein [Thioalkalivibrio sp. ALE19]